MRRLVCLVLLLFAVFCAIVRGEDQGTYNTSISAGWKALREQRYDDARKAAQEARQAWQDGPGAVKLLAAVEDAKPADPVKPVEPGKPIQVTVPPPVVNVTVPEPAPTLADLLKTISLALVTLWTAWQEIRHQIMTMKANGVAPAVQPPPPVRQMTDEEYMAETRRRFPPKG